jgi:carbon-monoxide dehydrogenase small subunit
VQQAFKESHGLQCGFCTPGFVMAITSYLAAHPAASDDELDDAISGNLCRCTGYAGIRRAARRARDLMAT